MLAAAGMLAGVEACVFIEKSSASSSRSVDAAVLTQVLSPAQCVQSVRATESLPSVWQLLGELNQNLLCELQSWSLAEGVIVFELGIAHLPGDGGCCCCSEHSQWFPLVEQVAPSNRARLWVQKKLVLPVHWGLQGCACTGVWSPESSNQD